MVLFKRAESSGHYRVTSTVLVQIWTNIGTRDCSIPTKTSPQIPSIPVLPSSIFPKDGVDVYVTCPMSGKFIPLLSNFYSSSADMDKYWNQRL
jgi:hypothetical protein